MKITNYLNLIIASVLFMGFLGCEEPTFEKTPSYVAFESPSASISEASITDTQDGESTSTGNFYTGRVYRSSSDLSTELTVDMDIGGVYAKTTDFADEGDDASSTFTSSFNESIVIPAGKTDAIFVISTVNDLFSSGNKNVVLSITGTSDASYEVGYSSAGISGDFSLTIIDDDCPIAIDNWVDTYIVKREVFTGGTNEGVSFATIFGRTYQLEFKRDPSDATGTKVIIDNSDGFDEFVSDGTVMSFLTCPGEVTFDALSIFVNTGNGFVTLVVETATYNEDAFEIEVNGELGPFGPYQFILAKKDN